MMSLQFHAIDVGHGDALLLQWDEPEGRCNVLIDGGAQAKETTANLARYLQAAQATTLDLMVATHIDDDHIGGLVNLLNPAGPWAALFTVKRFWGTNPAWVSSLEAAATALAEIARVAASAEVATGAEITTRSITQQRTLAGFLQARGTPQDYPDAEHDSSAVLAFQRLGLRILGPSPKQTQQALADLEVGARTLADEVARRAPQDEPARRAIQSRAAALNVGILTVTNNQSILLRLTYGGHSLILPGDAEAQEWNGAIASAGSGGLLTDILKLAHHGSRNGTPAIAAQAVKPQYGVISVADKYNLPDAEPFQLLRAARPGIRLFSTRYCAHVIMQVPDDPAAPIVIVKPDVSQRCSRCTFWIDATCHLEAEPEVTPPQAKPPESRPPEITCGSFLPEFIRRFVGKKGAT